MTLFPQSIVVAATLLATALLSFAADKSGVSPNAVSLPKGPGSIEGLGESFQPSLNTGTAKYSIPIKTPPGPAGRQPSLTLSYEGGAGNGPLGYGWNISLPQIQRRSDRGIPTYGEDFGVERADTFVTESREELVPTADGFHFCENESAFIRYRNAGDHWEGTVPDGTRLGFGVTVAARIAEGTRVFSWLLEREMDTRGNTIEYKYTSFPSEQNLNQKYLSEIRYGAGAPPWKAFHFIAFEYEDRSDWFEDGRAGFLVRTGKRLRTIYVGTQGISLTNHLAGDFNSDGTTDYLNRRYDLDYVRKDGTPFHWSLLHSIRITGADGLTALPAATFDYALSDPPPTVDASTNLWPSLNPPNLVLDNPQVDLIDLNADGLPDLLRTESGGSGHTVAINKGPVPQDSGWAIQWADPVAVDPGSGTSWNFDLASERTHLADMDGDGLADLVHKTADESVFYFVNRGTLGWSERREMVLQDSAPPAPFGNQGVRTADLDFDKRIDIVQSIDIGGGVNYRIWFNLGGQQYSPPKTVEASGPYDLSIPGVQIVDCNGDRVPDIARIQPSVIQVAAGLGYGRFAEPRSVQLPDVTLDDQQIANAKLADINGDGLADLVLERALPGTCWYWLNLGNYTLDTRRSVTGLPAVPSGAAVRWADLNGNGTTDLVYGDSAAENRLQMIELGHLVSGGLVPNLLTRIANGIGRVTTIEYAPSTRFALEDEAAGRPWPDSVPFPVTVVSAIRISDSLGHEYLTQYRYHDGYYDSVEKQFRGFAEVEQHEIGDASAPTLVSRSHFDTGRAFDAMKGRLLRASIETENGGVFSRETTIWADPPRPIRTGTNGLVVRFAHPTAAIKEILELGAGTPRRLESEMEYDDYGNLTRMSDFGIVVDADRSAFDDERITVAKFAYNLEKWIVQTPWSQTVQDENGVAISRSESFFDDETFSANNPGLVSVGNLTLRRDWIDPADPVAYVNSARTMYDEYGNPVLLLDPLAHSSADLREGHAREIVYDDYLHTFAERETIHIGEGKAPLVSRVNHDPGLATVLHSFDFNGHETRYKYDALGRLVAVVKPGDTDSYPTMEYAYQIQVPAPYPTLGGGLATGVVNYVEIRLLDRTPNSANSKIDHYFVSREYTDGLGRPLMTRTEAEPFPGMSAPRVAVTGALVFNARAKPALVLNPFFTTASGSLEDLLAFENIEAPGWQGQFHQDGALISLPLTNAHGVLTEYDATLREIRSINQDGTFSRTGFEPLIVREFDELDCDSSSPHFNTPVTRFMDGLGRTIRVDESARLNDDGSPANALRTWTTEYRYDLNDRVTRITDAQNNAKEIRYDGLGRRTWMNDPDAGISVTKYDDAGNVRERIDAKGQKITFTYDGANRLLSEDYHDEASTEFSYGLSPDVQYHYDTPAGAIDQGDGTKAEARNTKGMLAWVTDPSGAEHNSFDERGRLEWTVKLLPDPLLTPSLTFDPTLAFAYKTAFIHDSLDRVTDIIYPDNDSIRFSFNARNLLDGIVGGPSRHILSNLTYLPSEQQEQIRYGNGVLTTYAYDSRQRMARLLIRHTALSSELANFTYEIDPVSNVRAIEDHRSSLPQNDPRRNTQRFGYDDLYRLVRAEYNGDSSPQPRALAGAIDFRYDRIGNMLAQTSTLQHTEDGRSVVHLGNLVSGGSLGTTNRQGRATNEPAGPHALTSIRDGGTEQTYTYDANGNVTAIGNQRFTWDFRDRLVAIEDETLRADYRYDYTGRRVLKRVTSKNDNPSTFTLYPGEHFEVRDLDQPVKYVFNGDSRVARVTGSLSDADRIQRFRLRAGWNLLSLAVTPASLESLTRAGKLYLVDPTSGEYSALRAEDVVPAGSVLWLHATTNALVSVVGPYTDPAPPSQLPVGGSYLASPGLESWRLNLPSAVTAWLFDPEAGRWNPRLETLLTAGTNRAVQIAPGTAFLANTDTPVDFAPPDPALRLQYYHPDHLGSAALITDSHGALVEETTFYPFGETRTSYSPRGINEPYDFTQKERDEESGLHYYDSRYLSSRVGRFTSIDPKFAAVDALSPADLQRFLARPQMLNLYAYTLNNPLRYSDPTGLDTKDKVGWVNDAAGVAAGAAEEYNVWTGALSKGAGTAAGVVGKATAGVSVAMKTVDFIADPSSATGGQLLNESAKTLTSIAIPPVGLIWSILDLTGYGPSAILEHTEKSIQAKRATAKAYREAAKHYRATADMINEAAPRIAAQQKEAAAGLKVLKDKTARLNATSQSVLKGDTRSLEELNAAIAKHEKINRRLAVEMHRVEAHVRKLNAK